MKIEGDGKRLRIYISESDHRHGKPLYEEVVRTALEEGCAGATVLRGIEGFGKSSRIHTARILRLSENLPVVVEVVDTAERIDRVLPKLDAMVGEGLVTVEPVHIIAYRSQQED